MDLQSILYTKSNDYSKLSRLFKRKTNKDLVRGKILASVDQNISIIIPYYESQSTINNVLRSIQYQKGFSGNHEIILVNDSPHQRVVIDSDILERSDITIITCRKNWGAGIARNIGLAFSKFPLTLFLDSDTLLDAHYLQQHTQRHQLLKNLVTVSMRKKVLVSSSYFSRKIVKSPTIQHGDYNDFRFSKDLSTLFDRKIAKKGIIKLLKETDYFRLFGNGKKVLHWSLPLMLTTHNVVLRRMLACRIGGFDSIFKEAQWEDTAFGAKLIAANQYIVPVLSTAVVSAENSALKKKELFHLNERKYNSFLLTSKKKIKLKKFEQKYKSTKFVKKVERSNGA